MTRLQLLSSGMLQRRMGHISSFHPAAGDLTYYLFLNLVKEVVCGDQIQDILSLNALEHFPDKVAVATNNARKGKITDKQKQALKQLSGFLSSQSTSDAQPKKRSNHDDPDDEDISSPPPENSSEYLESTTSKRKNGKKGKVGKKKNGSETVKDFVDNSVLLSPAVAIKINNNRGGKGGKKKGGGTAKKVTTAPTVIATTPTISAADLAKQKKLLEDMKKVAEAQKRTAEEIARNSRALKQSEGN
jgi:hypothetical protein